MSDQLILAWTVDVAGSSFGPTQANTALAAVPLYADATTDPVLGQLFGLTVDDDTTTNDATSATRTLTLNMNAVNSPEAPPPFPCHPITSTPPVLPYPLRSTKTLPGSFFVENGSATVDTTMTQIPSLATGDVVQFLNQEGVFYTVLAVPDAVSITLTVPFTGTTGNTGAFKEVPAPVTVAALYSSSDLDTAGVSTIPAIPAGSGAHTVTITYDDSAGGGPFTATVTLTGKRPAAVALAMGSVDIAEITNMVIASTGGFGNNVGEITLVSLSDALPAIPPDATPFQFKKLTDEAQMLIDRHLAYLPPSFFALAQQSTSYKQLEGDFLLTTGSKSVPTTIDQTSALGQGDVIRFAAEFEDNFQLPINVFYVVDTVTPRYVTLTEAYRGIDDNFTGQNNEGANSKSGTKGNIGKEVENKASAAYIVSSKTTPAAPPSNDELSGPLGQFVATETAAPPPKPPLSPATVPAPTFLSDYFTQTLQLALAGVPITAEPIAFA